MRLRTLTASLLATFFVAGCASSVSPLYTKTDSVADPTIVGTWVGSDKDDSGTVRITQNDNGSYEVTFHDQKSADDSIYDAHLVKVGGASLADLLLAKYRHAGKDIDLPAGAVALHEIVKYSVVGDDLAVSTIDGDALDKAAKQAGFPLQITSTKSGTGSEVAGDTVILSNTEQLRRYFSAHPAALFGEAQHFKRQH